MAEQAVFNLAMKRLPGIGGKLLIAFGGVALLSVLSAAVGWVAFDRIATVQETVVTDTVPTLNKVRSLAQVSSTLIAATPSLINAVTDENRRNESQSLFRRAETLSGLLNELQGTDTDPAIVGSLETTAKQIIGNLEALDTLVARRIGFSAQFATESTNLLNALSDIVDLSEALVSNAATNTSATIANLYRMIETPTDTESLLRALDDLIEIDVDHMERMFETRHRVAVSGLIAEQVAKTDTAQGVAELQARFQRNARIIERRVGGIRDPHRRAQAEQGLAVLRPHAAPDHASNLFSLRLRSLAAVAEISELVVENQRLSEGLAEQVEALVLRSERRMNEKVLDAQHVLQRGYVILALIAPVSLFLAIPIMWFYVRNDVVKRVRGLADVTHALADGNLDVEVQRSGDDELTEMADALRVFRANALEKQKLEAEQKATEEELRRHKEELEQIVAERTTQLMEANRRLSEEVDRHAEARDSAEQASRAKTAFLATMSHEIRTPIASILGVLHLLDDEELVRSVRQRLDVVRASSETLLSIINDILDYSKIEAGHLDVVSADFDLTALIDDLRLLMAPIAERKEIAMIVVSDLAKPAIYRGDSGHIRQVLINIVGNAIKFTDRGQVVLHASETDNGVRFEIEDTGIGIPESRQAHLFDAFYQSNDPAGRRAGGTGLGLTICRRLITAMKGDIAVESRPGEGSLFTILLPLEKGRAAAAESGRTELLRSASRREALDVLLVEDNAVNRDISRAFLERDGHHVVEAETAGDAVEAATRSDFDVVLMDVSLPDFDGLTATQMIREQPDASRAGVPIIAISAHVFQEEIDTYLAAGMDGFLGKPFSPEQLRTALGSLQQSGSTISSGRLEVGKDSPSIFEAAVLDEDLPILGAQRTRDLINMFLGKIDGDLAGLNRAVEAGECETAATLAHALKSAAGSLGALALHGRARDLEIAAKSGSQRTCHEILDDFGPMIAETRRALVAYRDALDQDASAVNT